MIALYYRFLLSHENLASFKKPRGDNAVGICIPRLIGIVFASFRSVSYLLLCINYGYYPLLPVVSVIVTE